MYSYIYLSDVFSFGEEIRKGSLGYFFLSSLPFSLVIGIVIVIVIMIRYSEMKKILNDHLIMVAAVDS